MDAVYKSHIVSVDTLKAKKASPIIANFQNGFNSKSLLDSRVKRVEDNETGRQYALVATDDSVYKSDITDAGSSSVNTFLAIRNKKTNEMKLIQVTEASFKHTLYDNKHSIFENNVIDAKKVLHKDFGGKKAVTSYERLKRSAPNVEVLEETLERQLDAIGDEKFFERDIFDQSQEERTKFSQSIFPDIDIRGGKAVRDIFNARKLLGDEMMDHLADVAVQLLQAKKLPFVNSYLNNTVRSLQMNKNPDSKENIERISILTYVDGLIRLINNVRRSVENVMLSQVSAQIEQDIRKKFTIQGSFINSKFTRQKSIIYYLILILISTDSLEIDLAHVLDGVKNLAKTELLKYATVIGAKVKNKTTLYISRANLDKDSKLSAPMPSNKRRRK